MKRVSLLLIALVALPLYAQNTGTVPQESESPPQVTPLMQMKLDASKEILEGLALEEYDKIARNARKLRLLSMEAGWNVIQTKEYASQSNDFRRTSDLIAEAAENHDIGRAALGYVALTVRCVECHTYMRKQAKLEED